jgi:hypothetical protein
LRSFHRWYGRRRGRQHHGKHGEDGDDADHDLPSVTRFMPPAPQRRSSGGEVPEAGRPMLETAAHHFATAITHTSGTPTGPK